LDERFAACFGHLRLMAEIVYRLGESVS